MDARRFQFDPLAFERAVWIPGAGGPARFGGIMADFQRNFFATINPSLLAVAEGKQPPVSRAWVERTKGASKDSDLAVCMLWLLAFSKRAVRLQTGARDREQSKELLKCVRQILRINSPLNRFLNEVLDVQRDLIVNRHTEACLEFLSADSRGSHGSRPDAVLVNELSHVDDEEFCQTLLDNADKVPTCLVVIATNSGHCGSWQEKWKRAAVESDRWFVQEVKTPAPWIAEADLEESKRRNPPARYARLWQGLWVSDASNALTAGDIDQAFSGGDAEYVDEPLPHHAHFAGLDIGVAKDFTAFTVVARHHKTGRLRLAKRLIWRPPPGGRVDLDDVEAKVADAAKRFRIAKIGCDPWQAEQLVGRLKKRGMRIDGIPQSGAQLVKQSLAFLDCFTSGTLTLPKDSRLRLELQRLQAVEKSYGLRLSSPRTEDGHGDVTAAMQIAVWLATTHRILTVPQFDPSWGDGESMAKLRERLDEIDRRVAEKTATETAEWRLPSQR